VPHFEENFMLLSKISTKDELPLDYLPKNKDRTQEMESHLQVPKILLSVSYIKSELQEEEMIINK